MSDAITGADEIGDFDLPEEIEVDPLIPTGTYNGIITKAAISDDSKRIQVNVRLMDNDGFVMSNQEDPIDGETVVYFVHLLMESDKGRVSAKGKSTYDWKVNNLNKFIKTMNLNVKNKADLHNVMAEQQLNEASVVVGIKIKPHYQTGEPQNETHSIKLT